MEERAGRGKDPGWVVREIISVGGLRERERVDDGLPASSVPDPFSAAGHARPCPVAHRTCSLSDRGSSGTYQAHLCHSLSEREYSYYPGKLHKNKYIADGCSLHLPMDLIMSNINDRALEVVPPSSRCTPERKESIDAQY